MEKRKWIEYLIIALLVCALIFLVWLLIRKKPAEEPSQTDPDIVRQMPRADEVFTAEQIAQAKPMADTAGRVFAERFGSYSNQSAYGNIEDVYSIVTPELKTRLEALRANAEKEITETFYGVNTRVLSVETVSTSETGTRLLIQTQREEEVGIPRTTRVYTQKLTLTMQDVNGVWLVSDYAWEN